MVQGLSITAATFMTTTYIFIAKASANAYIIWKPSHRTRNDQMRMGIG